ncbi:hypothetical protein ANO11243_075230 [Dothideomycetidae sp. 11243]|nr:hypothetical protein ANO11243_075230 [fungal sp. No.11243]
MEEEISIKRLADERIDLARSRIPGDKSHLGYSTGKRPNMGRDLDPTPRKSPVAETFYGDSDDRLAFACCENTCHA